MKILYLCRKNTYDTKMSRVRFDSMAAIAKKADVVYSGPGWDNYDKQKTAQENIEAIYGTSLPDLVVVYKPEGMTEFENVTVPTCMRYNEMWPVKPWTKEITNFNLDLVIAHHLNDIPKYDHVNTAKFVHVPHSAEQSIYKDYGEPKPIDVLFTGAMSHNHYPFRHRLLRLVRSRLRNEVVCKVMGHPGGDLRSVKGPIGKEYAKQINRSKITLTCSSAYKYRLGKYIEIPMCGSMLAGDLPGQDEDQFKEFMLILDPNDSDDLIMQNLVHFVKNDDSRNRKIKKGLEWAKNYTQERYADRFLEAVDDFLREREDAS